MTNDEKLPINHWEAEAFAAAKRADAAEARAEKAEKTVRLRDSVIAMTVGRLGGSVEGKPTHRGNFLQRIDELRRIERRVEKAEAQRYQLVAMLRGALDLVCPDPEKPGQYVLRLYREELDALRVALDDIDKEGA